MSAEVIFIKLPDNFIIDESNIKDIINKEYSSFIDEVEISEYIKSAINCLKELIDTGCVESEYNRSAFFTICTEIINEYVVKSYDISCWNSVLINLKHKDLKC